MTAITKVISRMVPTDIARTNRMITGAVKNGYKKGSVLARENNQNIIRGTYTRSKSVAKELGTLKFTKDEIPAVAAAITSILPVPIPGLSIAVYALGHAIQKGLKFLK